MQTRASAYRVYAMRGLDASRDASRDASKNRPYLHTTCIKDILKYKAK